MTAKIRYSLIILILVIGGFSCRENGGDNTYAQNINKNNTSVKWSTFSEGLKNAESQQKPAIIFFYTEWCIFCKKMDSEVFGDSEILQYMNENFVSIRVNPEKNSDTIEIMGERVTAAKLMSYTGARGFPTMLFFNSKKKPVTTLPGFVEKRTFINILKYLKNECYESGVKIDDFIKKPEVCRAKKV